MVIDVFYESGLLCVARVAWYLLKKIQNPIARYTTLSTILNLKSFIINALLLWVV